MPSVISLRRWNRSLTAVAICLAVSLAAQNAAAGVSPENVVVVVNGDSPVSRTIANHYIDLRDIPTKNVVVLRDVPTDMLVQYEPFLEKILRPTLTELDKRGIAAQTRVIAYSADFPTAVRIKGHHDRVEDENVKKYQQAIASITGLTYFYKFCLTDSNGYLGFGSNLYARGKFKRHFVNPFTAEAKEEYAEAEKLFGEEKYAEAAELWDGLFEKHKTIPALAVRAAEAYSLADDKGHTIEMLRDATKRGWWSASYLRETPALDKHLDDAVLAQTLPYLDDSPNAWQGPIGFSAAFGWTISGSPIPATEGGVPYLASCCLAVVHQRGSTVEQAVKVLQRSSKSDRTFPPGRFAFGAGKDVRATTRFPGVADAMLYLQENGFDTEIFPGVVPTKEGQILGMMTGSAGVNLFGGPWMFARGAIAENLTSFGGVFYRDGHTKITEFLHAGAAMSSGAVAEPFALPMKFPTPMLYGFYAQGSSAIESFYQSVASPYQLLIVGDPLTQPFAPAPDETVDITLNVEDDKRRIRLARRSLGLQVPKEKKSPTIAIEVSLNDRLFKQTPAVPNIDVGMPAEASGVFDIRATLTGFHRTTPRVTFVSEIDVQGQHATPTATITTARTGAAGNGNIGDTAGDIVFSLDADGADRIEIMHLGEPIATLEGDKGEVTVSTKTLGGGPLRFRPVAYFGEMQVRGKRVVDRPE